MKPTLLLRAKNIYCLLFSLFLICSGTSAQTNLALGKPVTASGLFDPAHPLSMLTDGITNNANNWTSTGNAATPPNAEWLQIDLGSDLLIETVRITPRSGQEARGQRFLLVTWPSGAGNSLGSVPTTYVGTGTDVSNYNRLVYTNAANVSTANPLGSATVPEAANTNLGPAYSVAAPLTLNVGIHKARYILLLSLQDTYFDLGEVEVLGTTLSPQRDFSNGGFELGTTSTGVSYAQEANVPGWSTTEVVSMVGTTAPLNNPANGSLIEFWRSGANGVTANQGSYFAELNAYTNGALSQEPICVMAGESFTWSFAHRGRSGVDVMNLRIADVDVAQFSDNNADGGTHTGVVLSGGSGTTAITSTVPEGNGWTQYTGTWTNNTGASQTVIFAFRAVSSAGGNVSLGNFVDDASLITLLPLVRFSSTTATGPETTPSANLPKLLISGSIPAGGSSLQVDITGGTATRGVDYTTTPATGPITINLVAGTNYDGTLATAVDLSPYIQVNVDAIFGEGPETINMQLSSPVRAIINGGLSCTSGASTTVYTITEATTLPVLLKEFNASSNNCSVKLEWSTASEINFSHFEIEVSKDGNTYEKAGTVAATGNETGGRYVFNTAATENVLYYRLKMVDRDQSFEYSNVILLRTNCNKAFITVSPNPTNGLLYLKGIVKDDAISVYDASGKLVLKTKAVTEPGMINLSSFSNGTYTITINRNNEQVLNEQVIKRN